MRNKVLYGLAGAAAALAAVSGAALAAGDGKGGRGFERLDANGDGVISEADFDQRDAEKAERRAEMLAAADQNNDGAVSRDEWDAHREARRAARNPDQNNDGVVGRPEVIVAAGGRGDRGDMEGDGVLSV
ncbi:MAG: hypothetical protein AAGA09_02375, partial [Pseudomonadota bacterium]